MSRRQAVTQQIEHSFLVEAERRQVWTFIWDVQAVARCIPGCQQVETLEEGKTYRALVQRKLGPFSFGIELDIAVVETRPPEYLRVEVSGNDRRLRSQVREVISLGLQGDTDRRTTVTVAGTFTLTGLLASLNKHLIEAQVGQVLEDFTSTLQKAILERQPM